MGDARRERSECESESAGWFAPPSSAKHGHSCSCQEQQVREAVVKGPELNVFPDYCIEVEPLHSRLICAPRRRAPYYESSIKIGGSLV